MMYPELLQLLSRHMQPPYPVPQLPWAPTQPQTTQPSPPPSPPTQCVNGWQLRNQTSRVSSFTIDAILAHQRNPCKTTSSVEHNNKFTVQDMRLSSRPSPYPNSAEISSPSNGSSTTGKSNKTKRIRTIFTAEQLERLEAEFANQQYMVGPERVYLAQSLRLSEAQVKVWFQNRRIKWRKQTNEKQHKRFANSYMDHLDSENAPSPQSSPEPNESRNLDSADRVEEAPSSMPAEKLPPISTEERQSLTTRVQEASRSSTPSSPSSGNSSMPMSSPSLMASIATGFEALKNFKNSCESSKYTSKNIGDSPNVCDRSNTSNDSHSKFQHCLVDTTNNAPSHQPSLKEINYQSPLKKKNIS